MMNRKAEKEQGSASSKSRRSGIAKLLDDTAVSTYEDVRAIIDAKFELLKIELTEKLSVIASAAVVAVILVVGMTYLLTTVALLIGELLGHPFLGYLIVSLLFLSCFLFFTRFKPLLLRNLIQKILLSLHDYN
ncbi:MAG: phage holin family protein [Pelodictyon phaeoclathratiforme]